MSTCFYSAQNSMFHSLDARSFTSFNNNSATDATGFFYYGGDVFHQPSLDLNLDLNVDFDFNLDIQMNEDGLMEEFVSSGLSSSPLSQQPSPTSSSSSGSSLKAEKARGGLSDRNGRIQKEDKICGVCGDKALGFNFDAISCESCKAFFRRNAPKGLDYFKCPYDEKCQMDVTNRRFCKRCRLKKCFGVGMRKEFILTEVEKATKKRKIEENRFLKKISPAAMQNMNTQKLSLDVKDTELMETEWHNPLPLHRNHQHQQHQQQQQQQQELTSSRWQTVPLLPEDSAAIQDIRLAYRNSLEVNMEQLMRSKDEASLTNLVNIAELSIRRVIAMVKQVTSFKNLPQVEQIHLLKGGSIELLIIRSVITFDQEKQHFLDPLDHEETNAIKIDQLEKAENGTGLFEDHMKFIRSLAIDLKADETTLILLLIISLFSPDRENLTWKSLVSEEQEKYSRLLGCHLRSIHPPHLASRLFAKLLGKLTDIRNLNEDHSQVLLKVNSEGIQPLMKEVLDLTC